MSTADPLTESIRGYVSPESKRRFTLVAGILGGVFFLAQLVLPMVMVFLIMMPMMMDHSVSIADVDEAGLWHGQLWFTERATRVNWRDPRSSTSMVSLRHVNLTDLSDAGPAIPLEAAGSDSNLEILPVGERLWVMGANSVSYYEDGALTRLSSGSRPRRVSKPFVYQGAPAVISLGTHPMLATLHARSSVAEWTSQEFPLSLPQESGSFRSLHAVEAGGRLYLFAEFCTEEPERCSVVYREPAHETWLPLIEDACSCANWTAVALGPRPAVVMSERESGAEKHLALVTLTDAGPQRQRIELGKGRFAWSRWRALSQDSHLVLVTEGMPGSLTLAEVVDGRTIRSVKKTGSFPFGPNMMLLMEIPQVLPILLSLILAFLLTGQMRRHRVRDYVFEGTPRAFASLWQRALAQLVDLVPLGAGFLLPGAWMWRMFSDPENLVESGPRFMLWFFGFFVGAFVCALLVLVVYSYFEGRFGKTPGKWLLRIRVLGTDLKPCGFGRALLRNLLTFVDGFFSFLVGALLVALTENWQRLGDLAARTIVVVDEKPA